MKKDKVFLDSDVILDLLTEREPHFDSVYINYSVLLKYFLCNYCTVIFLVKMNLTSSKSDKIIVMTTDRMNIQRFVD